MSLKEKHSKCDTNQVNGTAPLFHMAYLSVLTLKGNQIQKGYFINPNCPVFGQI